MKFESSSDRRQVVQVPRQRVPRPTERRSCSSIKTRPKKIGMFKLNHANSGESAVISSSDADRFDWIRLIVFERTSERTASITLQGRCLRRSEVMHLEAMLCTFMHLNHVNFLQTNLNFFSPKLSNCTSSAFVNPQACKTGSHFGKSPLTLPLLVRHRPVVVSTNVQLKMLRFLEETCYPSVQVWCRPKTMSTLSKILPRECDGFVVSTVVEPAKRIEEFSTADVDAFVSRAKFQICSDFGILNDDGSVHKTVSGMSLCYVMNEHDIYTGQRRPAREISENLSGMLQGFELSILQVFEKQFNFSSANCRSGGRRLVVHGRQPEYESGFYDKSVWSYAQTLGYIMRKEAVFLYGDFSVLDPRQHYVEHAAIHDIDSNAFLSTVFARKLSGMSMLTVCGRTASACYLLFAFVVSLVIVFVERKLGFLHVFVIIVCMIFQQSTPRPRKMARAARCVEQVWRVGVFSLACIVSARIVTLLTNSEVDGRFQSIKDAAKYMGRSENVWVFHDSRFHGFNNMGDGNLYQPGLEDLAKRAVPCTAYTDECFDRLLSQRISLVFAEGLNVKRQAWQRRLTHRTHLLPEHLNNCFQAFGMQKRCVLRRMFSSVVRRLVDAGLVEAFKDRAGLEYSDVIQVTVVHQLQLADIWGTFVLIIGLQLSCLLCLCLELAYFLVFVKLRPEYMRFRLPKRRKHSSPRLFGF